MINCIKIRQITNKYTLKQYTIRVALLILTACWDKKQNLQFDSTR